MKRSSRPHVSILIESLIPHDFAFFGNPLAHFCR